MIDKHYLSLQFKNRLYEKNGSEFQGFVEGIMEKGVSGFKKVRPYGNKGDGGNDGFIADKGVYYQVYAPKNPNEKDAEAAKKIKEDFEKLKKNWNKISEVKTFFFVFNDKGTGTSIEIESALADLKKENEGITFESLLAKKLEKIFFSLTEEEILSLGFNIDSRKALSVAHEYLDKLETELDRDNGEFVMKALESLELTISGLNDENLTLDYEILQCRALQKVENIEDAKAKYESLRKRYPNDPRAFLYLAEIYLNDEDFDKNSELLNGAEKIDSAYPLLTLEKLVRDYRLGTKIEADAIDENSFPEDKKMKSNFYRLYAFFLNRAEDRTRAGSFIERALQLNPDKIANYDAKLALLEEKVFTESDGRNELKQNAEAYLSEIETTEAKVKELGGMNQRNQALFNMRKIGVYRSTENIAGLEKLGKETFDQILQCHFDQLTDKLLVGLLMFADLPDMDFEKLLNYVKAVSGKQPSNDLLKIILVHFMIRKELFAAGKKFFGELGMNDFTEFIGALEEKKYDDAWSFLKDDVRFAVSVASTGKDFPELRKMIVEKLPDDGSVQKDKLLLLLNYEENKMDEAFELLKKFDFSNLSYFECRPILQVAKEKKAWDFEVKILEKLLEHAHDVREILNLKLQLFNANLNLGKFPDAIQIGEAILGDDTQLSLLDEKNKEALLANTLVARFQRSDHREARSLVQRHKQLGKTFEFKSGIEARIYLKDNEPQSALQSVIDAVKIVKTPSNEQYGSLFFFFIELGDAVDLNPASAEKISDGCFVKLKGQDEWYFIGNGDELDATKIVKSDARYSVLAGKKVGEEVEFEEKYRSQNPKHSIEHILPIEKYIFWQSREHAQKLSLERRWDVMEMIEVPTTGDTIDTKYVIARLQDEREKRGDFFDLYCKNNLPLAFLAVNEGGLTHAIGRITSEQKGFIKFSTGTITEMDQQKAVASKILKGTPFYIDGTSALVLAETGLLGKIFAYLPEVRVPQSVITFLLETKERFTYTRGQVGHMSLSAGKLSFTAVNQEKREEIKENFQNCITLLESKPESVRAISSANKADCFSEQKVQSELCDACIFAQEESVPVLTEDYLYLQANEFETKKKAPEYFSTFALIRILYETGKISPEDYFKFFAYLSGYRFRFLPFSSDDLENAVFGKGAIATINLENIRLFNFPLTLSEEYGVPFDRAFTVVGRFIVKLLLDDSVLSSTVERIFAEIIDVFPSNMGKKQLAWMFLRVCVQAVNQRQNRVVAGTKVQEKIDKLSQFTEVLDSTFLLS